MTRATIKVSVPGTPAQPGSGGESPEDAGRSRVIRAGNPAQNEPRSDAGQSEPFSDTPDDTTGRGPQIVCPPSGEGHEGDLPESMQAVPLRPESAMPDAAYP